jgi:hypothetical protein
MSYKSLVFCNGDLVRFMCILVEEVPLCFSSHNKTNGLLRTKHNNII